VSRLELFYTHEVCDVCKRDADLYVNDMGYTTRFQIDDQKVLVVCDDCLAPLADALEEKALEVKFRA